MNALRNGVPVASGQPALLLQDRAWQYGDGVFETMLLSDGRLRFLTDHLDRLQAGCARLGMTPPPIDLLRDELQLLCGGQQHAVVKLVVMRGGMERGYRPAVGTAPVRICQLFAPPPASLVSGIRLRWCDARLSRNVLLAGIKHCNRLEQVLAQAEWSAAEIAEGLMLDTEGELVCGTMSNVFLILNGVLVTPDLRYSGVAGVMRKNVLRLAAALHIESEIRAVRAEELVTAQEWFVCNAVRGIQPALQLQQRTWPVGQITSQLQAALRAC